MSFDPFHGDEAHPDWAAYVATNLREALKLVPDTGDWHGALRQWCDLTAGDTRPNRTAEQMAADALQRSGPRDTAASEDSA